MTRFKGDNTGAFGGNFITIDLVNPYEFEVSKAIFIVGCVKKEFENPVFPLTINFDEEESKRLNFKNTAYLVVYDSEGRQKTCKGTLNFPMKEGVI